MRTVEGMTTRSGAAAHVAATLRSLAEHATALADMPEACGEVAERYRAALASGATLWFAGNGGSAADAQHLAAEYVVRYARNRPPMRAVALTTDTSLLTAAANDLGFDQVFARQVEALGRPGDVLILHSTSGRSPNLLQAARVAREAGLTVVAFLGGEGGGGPLRELADLVVMVPGNSPGRIQELQLAIQHAIAEFLEDAIEDESPGKGPHDQT